VVSQDMQAATNQQNHAKQIKKVRNDNNKRHAFGVHMLYFSRLLYKNK
jgi:hypothetical protein